MTTPKVRLLAKLSTIAAPLVDKQSNPPKTNDDTDISRGDCLDSSDDDDEDDDDGYPIETEDGVISWVVLNPAWVRLQAAKKLAKNAFGDRPRQTKDDGGVSENKREIGRGACAEFAAGAKLDHVSVADEFGCGENSSKTSHPETSEETESNDGIVATRAVARHPEMPVRADD